MATSLRVRDGIIPRAVLGRYNNFRERKQLNPPDHIPGTRVLLPVGVIVIALLFLGILDIQSPFFLGTAGRATGSSTDEIVARIAIRLAMLVLGAARRSV